jgi:putative addiction module component (TIGR02574 family)
VDAPGFRRFVRLSRPATLVPTPAWSLGPGPAKLGGMAQNELFDAALALPPETRIELASKLLASVEGAPSEEWTQAWLAECDRRVAAADSGAEAPVPWNEAYGRLRGRLEQR